MIQTDTYYVNKWFPEHHKAYSNLSLDAVTFKLSLSMKPIL